MTDDIDGYVIICMGLAIGAPCSVTGQYLKAYNDRTGHSEWTNKADEAMSFPHIAMAVQKYRQPLVDEHNVPVQRKDGSGAERPLTAFSIQIVPYADDDKKENTNAAADGRPDQGDPNHAGQDAGGAGK